MKKIVRKGKACYVPSKSVPVSEDMYYKWYKSHESRNSVGDATIMWVMVQPDAYTREGVARNHVWVIQHTNRRAEIRQSKKDPQMREFYRQVSASYIPSQNWSVELEPKNAQKSVRWFKTKSEAVHHAKTYMAQHKTGVHKRLRAKR